MLIPLELAKAHARINGNSEDVVIALLLRSCVEIVQDYTAFYLDGERDFTESVQFDNDGIAHSKYRPNNNKVSVQEWASAPFQALVKRNKIEVSKYAKRNKGALFNINPRGFLDNFEHGCDENDAKKEATIDYKAGFCNYEAIPPDIIHAILKLFAWHFEKRGDEPISKYVRKGGASSLYDNRGFEFSGASDMLSKYRLISI